MLWGCDKLTPPTRRSRVITVIAANVHLILGNPNPYRVQQLSYVLTSIRKFSRKGDTVVIAGDFNVDKADEREGCFELLEKEGYVDSASWHVEKEGGGTSLETWSLGNKYVGENEEDLGSRLDYVWIKSGGEGGQEVKGMDHQVIFNGGEEGFVSDHYGVKAIFRIGT